MFRNYKVRTDLALEARERFDEKDIKNQKESIDDLTKLLTDNK